MTNEPIAIHVETPLSDFEQRYVQTMLRRLLDVSTEAFQCEAWITREEPESGDYRLEIEVRGPGGLNVGAGAGSADELREAVDQAEDKVRKQLDEWIDRRLPNSGSETRMQAI